LIESIAIGLTDFITVGESEDYVFPLHGFVSRADCLSHLLLVETVIHSEL